MGGRGSVELAENGQMTKQGLREEIERWLLASAVGGVLWPLGLLALVLGISDEGGVSLRTVVGRGELFLIAGGLCARGLTQFGSQGSRRAAYGIQRQRVTWICLSLLLFSMSGWAARMADVTGDPKLLESAPPWTVTYVGGAMVLAALAIGVAVTAVDVACRK